jgi:hypothetical protein
MMGIVFLSHFSLEPFIFALAPQDPSRFEDIAVVTHW